MFKPGDEALGRHRGLCAPQRIETMREASSSSYTIRMLEALWKSKVVIPISGS